MKEIMLEEKPEIVEVEHEEFVAKAVIENARNMARYSIGQTSPPNFASERATDMEVARYLSGVEVDDKNLAQDIKEALDRNLTDPDGAFQATSLAVGKAIAAEEVASPKERGFLKRVSDRVTKETGQFIASKSGKKGLAVVYGFSLVATACSGNLGGILPRPVDIETPTAVATEAVELPTTLIAPAPTEAAENEVVISQRLITQEEVISAVGGEGQEVLGAFNSSYANFQTELSLEFPNSAFEMWGVQAQTQDGGSIISPFFEVVGEDGKSEAVAIVISVGEGDFRYVRMVPLEVQGPDGRMYLTLSQTISAETGQEIPPEPMFWVTYSLEEWNALSNEEQLAAIPSFNGLRGIVPNAQPLEGARMAVIRELTVPTPEAVRDEWQVSADGRIFYNEATLAEGLFTINEAATQYTWDELMRSLYQINVAGENRTFLRQFPTLESFREEALSGRPIENMWIAIGHPMTGLRFAHQATWEPVEPVDLSTVALEFSYVTYEDIVSGVYDERPFINRSGSGNILTERVEINGRTIIRITFHQDVMYDDPEWGILGFSQDYTPEHDLQSATQVVFEWFWLTDHMQDDAVGEIRIGDTNPPMFNVDRVYPSRSEATGFTQDLEHSPFKLR